MRHLTNGTITLLVKYALILGIMLGGACFIAGQKLGGGTEVGSLFINLSADFFMTGLTISVLDGLIKRHERQRFGDAPDLAKEAINNEIWQLVGVLSFTVRDALSKTIDEIIASALTTADEVYPENDSFTKKARIIELAQLVEIDDRKLTHAMFSDLLRLMKDTLTKLDILVLRYTAVLDSEDIAKAIHIRDTLEAIGTGNQLVVLSTFFGQHPNSLLDSRQRAAFMSMKDNIIKLTNNLL